LCGRQERGGVCVAGKRGEVFVWQAREGRCLCGREKWEVGCVARKRGKASNVKCLILQNIVSVNV
jgi:hypothetical protein